MSIATNGATSRNTNRAACHYNGADYVCYQDAQYIKVVKMVNGAIVQGPVTVLTYDATTTGRTTGMTYGDIHGTPSITVVQSGTYAGRVLIATALHVTHLDVFRSNATEDISAFTRSRVETSQANGVDGATYPRLLALANGNIFCCYRLCNSATQHWQAYKISADGGETWGSRVVVVKPKDGALNDVCYAAVEMKPGTNEIHIPWSTSDYSTWFDVHHIYTTDGGTTWRKSDGTAITLPATNTSVPAFKTSSPRINSWVYDVAFDPITGYPRMVGYDSDATKGKHYIWEWNGASWDEFVLAEGGSAATSYNAGFHPQYPHLVIVPEAPIGVTSGLNADGQVINLYLRRGGTWNDMGDLTAPPGTTWDGFAQFVDHGDGTFVYSHFSTFNSNYTFAATVESGIVNGGPQTFYFDVAPSFTTSFRFDVTPKFEYPNVGWTERQGSNALWGERMAGATTWTLRR